MLGLYSKPNIWKHTTSYDKSVFFFQSYLATSTANNIELKFSQVCYFYAYVEIHQVRKLVLDKKLPIVSSWIKKMS